MEKEYNYKIGKKAIHPIAFARGLLAKTDKKDNSFRVKKCS